MTSSSATTDFKRTLKSQIWRLNEAGSTPNTQSWHKKGPTAVQLKTPKQQEEDNPAVEVALCGAGDEDDEEEEDEKGPPTISSQSFFKLSDAEPDKQTLLRPTKSPLPPHSPLLSRRPNSVASSSGASSTDSTLRRARQFNRCLRRAKSFRSLRRARSQSSLSDDNGSELGEGELLWQQGGTGAGDVTLLVRRGQVGGRQGYRIVLAAPEGASLPAALQATGVMERVAAQIRQAELSGRQVPDRITLDLASIKS